MRTLGAGVVVFLTTVALAHAAPVSSPSRSGATVPASFAKSKCKRGYVWSKTKKRCVRRRVRGSH